MAGAGDASPEAAQARTEGRQRYERYGFVSPLHALGAAGAAEARDDFRRFQLLGKKGLEGYPSHEMNHAWLPWLRDLGRHTAIVSAVGDVFCTRSFCLYDTELWHFEQNQPATGEWYTDSSVYTPLFKPVDRRHLVTAFVALTACDGRRGCLRVRPTAVGGKAMQEELCLELRPGEFSLHGPSTKYSVCPNRTAEVLYAVVLRYVRASTADPQAGLLGKERVLWASGTDDQHNFDPMPELPGEVTSEGAELRKAMMQQRWQKTVAGEAVKGRDGLKRPLLAPSSYTLVRTLEYGTTAIIHLAKWGPGQKGVVVKRVRDQTSQRAVQRHYQEARFLERLVHPRIVQLVGVADTLDPLDMLLEFCPEGCLTSYMQQGPGSHAAQLLCDLMCALAYMHRESFAHLDVKPDNLLISSSRGKLCDFGTALHMTRSCYFRLTNVGTPGYRAPEIDSGFESDATKADVWSLGKTGAFVNQYAKGTWACLDNATDRDPEERLPVKDCLEIFKELHGGTVVMS